MVEQGTSDSRERIMDATYQALIETGFAALTMGDIAEKSETSTSLLHYHFDTKDDLLVAFLDHGLNRWEAEISEASDQEPTARLFNILSSYVLDPSEAEQESFHAAITELRSHAPYDERYRSRFRRADTMLIDAIAGILREGQEDESFHNIADQRETAELLLATVDGARTRGVTLGDPVYTSRVLESLYSHVLSNIFNDYARNRWRTLVEA